MTLLSRRGLLASSCILCGASRPVQADEEPCLTADALSAPPPLALTPAEQERDTIHLLLAMALVYDGWGVDASRPDLVAAYAVAEPGRHFNAYAGHNIGAVIVAPAGDIICFALNRIIQMNSTLAHAEARAIRAAIGIANVRRFPSPPGFEQGNLLRGCRLYTTLEPCVQCTGIMALANIGAVVFGQDDPGQHRIANLVWRVQNTASGGAALPVRAVFLPQWQALADAYRNFLERPPAGAAAGPTAFLQTVDAYSVFRDAAARLESLTPGFPDNDAPLRAARAFRARWRDSIYLGGAPY